MISYKVFMNFVDDNNNAEKLLHKECYRTWVVTRKSPPKKPEESFRRVLTAHVCGVDGRKPFPPEVEASLLRVLRRKQVWECFRGTDVSIGIRGFRNIGYHEKASGELANVAASSKRDARRTKQSQEKLAAREKTRKRDRAPPENPSKRAKDASEARSHVPMNEDQMDTGAKQMDRSHEMMRENIQVQRQLLEQMKQYNMHLMQAQQAQTMMPPFQPTLIHRQGAQSHTQFPFNPVNMMGQHPYSQQPAMHVPPYPTPPAPQPSQMPSQMPNYAMFQPQWMNGSRKF